MPFEKRDVLSVKDRKRAAGNEDESRADLTPYPLPPSAIIWSPPNLHIINPATKNPKRVMPAIAVKA